MKILITGGSGLVGKTLTKLLQQKGYDVAWLSRRKSLKTDVPIYVCNYVSGEIDTEAILSADVIIHLAGANINGARWTKKRQQVIIDSRVKTAHLIFNTLQGSNHQLKAFISASAIGYYGAITSEEIFSENSKPGNDFLAHTCKEWEKAADKFNALNVRVVKIRTGIVMSKSGGAFEKIAEPFKFGAKVVLGSGKQYLPWIHINDLCKIYLKAIEDKSMFGIYNAVAPEHVSYKNFAGQLKPYFKSVFLNVTMPAFALRLLFGKRAVLLLEGSRVDAQKIIHAGFSFDFPALTHAFDHLTGTGES